MALANGGCAGRSQGASQPASSLAGVSQSPGDRVVTPLELQARVMDFADLYITRLDLSSRELLGALTDPEQRRAMHVFWSTTAWSIYDIASAPNPEVAFLDMVAVVTLQVMVFEEHDLNEVYGGIAEARGLLKSLQDMKEEIWRQAAQLLDDHEIAELKRLISEWRQRHPGPQFPSVARLDELAYARLRSPAEAAQGRGLILTDLTLLGQETRLFAERMAFLAVRMPTVLSAHLEAIVHDLTTAPSASRVLEDVHAVSTTLTQLPQELERIQERLMTQVSAEREAAVQQIAESVDEQREALMAQITAERQAIMRQVAEAQGELRLTLDAAQATIEAGNQLVTSVDALMARMEPPEGAAVREPSEPLDLAEVRRTLEEATRILDATHELVSSAAVEDRLQQVGAAIGQANDAVRGSAGYFFRLAVAFVIITVAAVVCGVLALRIVPRRGQPT
jgi:hypothetical protein